MASHVSGSRSCAMDLVQRIGEGVLRSCVVFLDGGWGSGGGEVVVKT